jgi:hypothetical protein
MDLYGADTTTDGATTTVIKRRSSLPHGLDAPAGLEIAQPCFVADRRRGPRMLGRRR